MEMVEPAHWHSRAAAALSEGFTFLANLTAVDEVGHSDHIRVLLWLENPDDGAPLRLAVLAERDDPHLPDLADILPGAAWLQRQIHDFFGVRFEGADERPLIRHGGGTATGKGGLRAPGQ